MKILATAALISTFAISTGANAALVGRLETSPGSGVYQAYYDTETTLMWMADASSTAPMLGGNAITWAAGLDIGGLTDWRLPSTAISDPGCSSFPAPIGTGCTGSTMAALFNSGITAATPGPFSGLQAGDYWSASYISGTNQFYFDFGDGEQNAGLSFGPPARNVWAVRTGDVSPIPLPAAAWLFASALLGLGVVKRKSA